LALKNPTASVGFEPANLDFLALKNPTASVGFEPANLGTKSQHVTLYTTEAAIQHLI
jgi:hypothetical protein